MSSRMVRRVLEERGADQLPPNSVESGLEESELPSAAASFNPFDLLDDEVDETDRDQLEATTEQNHSSAHKIAAPSYSTNKKSKGKKKKSRGEKAALAKLERKNSIDSILEDLSIESKNPQQETVNKGKEVVAKKARNEASSVLAIDARHLKAENELRKIFGSKVVDSAENKRGVGTSRMLLGRRRAGNSLRKTLLVTPLGHWPPWDKSMSMELIDTVKGVNYFRYVYPESFKHVQEIFEVAKAANDLNAIAGILASNPYHVDSILTFAELYKYSGEHQLSADTLDACLFALECAWHPEFSPLHGNHQLKFSHNTNKPLFTALFNHMKNLDRRGCHRSALEICKFLLSLDLDDPKGALFFIDYFALRSREYAWLEQFAEEYPADNAFLFFPNFVYSLPIARFYLESGNDSSQARKASAIDLMKQALMLHPSVLQKIVDKAPLKDQVWNRILQNPFFGSAEPGSPSVEHLVKIYVERSYIIWRFPELQKLMQDAALSVIESLKDGQEAYEWACVRKEAFPSDKNEYAHLLVSDFSDTIPTLPPEELRPFMIAPGMEHQVQVVDHELMPEIPHVPEEVVPREAAPVRRNPFIALLESFLPWGFYGDREDTDEDHGRQGNGN